MKLPKTNKKSTRKLNQLYKEIKEKSFEQVFADPELKEILREYILGLEEKERLEKQFPTPLTPGNYIKHYSTKHNDVIRREMGMRKGKWLRNLETIEKLSSRLKDLQEEQSHNLWEYSLLNDILKERDANFNYEEETLMVVKEEICLRDKQGNLVTRERSFTNV